MTRIRKREIADVDEPFGLDRGAAHGVSMAEKSHTVTHLEPPGDVAVYIEHCAATLRMGFVAMLADIATLRPTVKMALTMNALVGYSAEGAGDEFRALYLSILSLNGSVLGSSLYC